MSKLKNICCFILFIFLCTIASGQYINGEIAYNDLYDSDLVKSFKSHISYLSSRQLEGRAPGSEGEKMAGQYVQDIFESYGVDVISPDGGDLFGIRRASGDTLTSRNIIGYVQGSDPKLRDRYVVVGARLDNLGKMTMTVDGQQVDKIFPGANGNASGLAMLLELARGANVNSQLFRRSVIFVAFGSSSETYAGSWYFLNRSFADVDKIDAMINLDMLGAGEDFYAYTASNEDMNRYLRELSVQVLPIHPELIAYEPYPSDHRSFYAKEIPSVFFTRGKYREHNSSKDTEMIIDYLMMEREMEYIYNFIQQLSSASVDFSFDSNDVPKRTGNYDDVVAYYDCDQRPMFLNSADPRQFMEKWVYQYLKYPKDAVKDGIQGRVMVDFIIDKSGKVIDVRVVRGVDPLLDAEAIRVVSASPKWRPGRVKGNKVRTSLTIPVEFRLEKRSSKPSFGFKKHTR